MYTTPAPRIRDQSPAYGPHEVEGDAFPAATVLRDLTRAPERDVPLILGRYAAVRSWLLREDGAEPDLVRHAVRTARSYLAVLGEAPDREPLEQLTRVRPDLEAAWEAARAAARASHDEGAYALLRTGYLTARRRSEIPWSARFAAEIATLLEDRGMDGAPLWARRAARLRRLAGEG